MVYAQRPSLVRDMNVEELSLNGRARDLDAGRPERRMEMPSSNSPMRSAPSSSRKDGQVAPLRPTVGRRIFRGLTRFIFTLLIGVGLTLGWQSYGEMARQMLAAQAPGLAQLLPVSTMPSFATASSVPMQQLAPLTSDLDVVRHSLEQLAARQEQMAQSIAALQAVDEDIRQKLLSTPAAQQPASILQPKPIMQPPTAQSAAALRRPPSATSPLR